MAGHNSRDAFLENVRRALGRPPGADPGAPPDVSSYLGDPASVRERARSVKSESETRADALLSELETAASHAGWVVSRKDSSEDAARYIESLARELGARSAVHSAHPVLDRLRLEERLTRRGIDLRLMAIKGGAGGSEIQRARQSLREVALDADLGITGVDYAIAETGSCVLLAAKGVSRLVSLLPPVHVAVVERGQVLPSLDELFVLHRSDLLGGEAGYYMNIISGPSRSADIEQTLVKGVHGPREVHMLLLG